MADQRFFTRAGPFTLGELAVESNAEIAPGGDPGRRFEDVAPLESGGRETISFFDNPRYREAFRSSKAGACITTPEQAQEVPEGMDLLLTPQPYRAYAEVARKFYPEVAPAAGRHPSAVIDPEAKVGPKCSIAAGAVIEARAEIGAGCVIGANAVIAQGVVIGPGTRVGAGAYLSHCLVGARCQLHPGVRIGTRGFGFAMDPKGFLDVPQLGRVIIGDDVEIGANSTIDRGAGPDTVVGDGSKIDNLVQLGHNVQLGKGCVLVAQSGVAGSTKLEDYVVVAAQGGVSGHLRIGKGAQVAAKSGVMRDIPPGQTVSGIPAMPIKEFFRLYATWRRQVKGRGKADE